MLKENIIKKFISTWKSEKQKQNNNVYTFYVDPRANKFQIKIAVESIFETKVDKISTLREKSILRDKKKHIYTKLRKKAFIKLKNGYQIFKDHNFQDSLSGETLLPLQEFKEKKD